MTNIWQQHGSFVATGENLSPDTVKRYSEAGGRWYVPVIYGDSASGPWNLSNIEYLKSMGNEYGVAVGGWYNGFGYDPKNDADAIATIHQENGLRLIILDLEAAYQYPGGNPNLMPILVKELRNKLPKADIGVSTNGLNNSMIFNGRTLTPPQSFYDLAIRVLPQWYNAPVYGQGPWTRPDANMNWLKTNGTTDYNFFDLTTPNKSKRGVPLSYVHGTLEATGLEGSDLATELAQLRAAKNYGYTYGWSIYLLENTPYSDFDLIEAENGKTFLV